MRDILHNLGVLFLVISVFVTVGYGIYTFFHPSMLHLVVSATAAAGTIALALKVTRDG